MIGKRIESAPGRTTPIAPALNLQNTLKLARTVFGIMFLDKLYSDSVPRGLVEHAQG